METETDNCKLMTMDNVLNISTRAEFRAWLMENHDKKGECLIALKRGEPRDDGCFYYPDAVFIAVSNKSQGGTDSKTKIIYDQMRHRSFDTLLP